MIKTLDSLPTRIVGLAQASAVTTYVLLFALFISRLENKGPDSSPFLSIMLFLTAFIVSALICGSLALGYPALLALSGQLKRALQVVAWTGAWMVLSLAVVTTVVLALR